MQKVKCPHCKKNIELSEVAKEQAKHLAAQEIKQLKAQNQDDKKKFKKDLEGKYAKDREKDAEKIKELEYALGISNQNNYNFYHFNVTNNNHKTYN